MPAEVRVGEHPSAGHLYFPDPGHTGLIDPVQVQSTGCRYGSRRRPDDPVFLAGMCPLISGNVASETKYDDSFLVIRAICLFLQALKASLAQLVEQLICN